LQKARGASPGAPKIPLPPRFGEVKPRRKGEFRALRLSQNNECRFLILLRKIKKRHSFKIIFGGTSRQGPFEKD
jgi:hypothetical protein